MIRFLTFTHEVGGRLPGGGGEGMGEGGNIQWQLSQGTGKIHWCKSFKDFFFNFVTKNKGQKRKKKLRGGSLHEKTFARKSLGELFTPS